MTAPSPTADLQAAKAEHVAGRLPEASALYRRVLAAKPRNLEAAHGLALIAVDLGEPDRAIPLLARCLATQPDNGVYRTSLGLALLRKGEFEQAAAHLLEAANRMPRALEPRLYLARALGQMGRWGQAADVLSATAEIVPDRAEVWAAKGNAERALRRHAAAETSLRRALALSPEDPDVLNNLGVVLRALGHTEQAVNTYRQALARAPDHSLIHANLGNALAFLGRAAAAEPHLRRAVDLDPSAVEARCNLGAFLTREQRPAEAIAHFRAALEAAPDNIDAWTNLGVALLDTGDPAEAEQCYRRAIALAPDNAEAHYNLAWVLLLTGQWIAGWQEYEWRWKLANFSSRKRDFDKPLWDGSPLPAGTLLLHAEQGLGDAIQFVRYAATAKARCARVVVECPRALVRLFLGIGGIDAVIAAGDTLPAFDVQAPFMTLPRLFATTPATAPAARAYIAAPASVASHLRLPETAGPRIGVVWAGSPDNKIDRRRTLPARLFAPLMTATAADFVSLQVGPRAEEVSDLPAARLVFACDGRVADFAETAAIVGQLDLVIGVDTAVMHLAAAMGKPTWLLLPTMPDYRWLLGRDDSPWYPAIRLFRQDKSDSWPDVIARITAALTIWQRGTG